MKREAKSLVFWLFMLTLTMCSKEPLTLNEETDDVEEVAASSVLTGPQLGEEGSSYKQGHNQMDVEGKSVYSVPVAVAEKNRICFDICDAVR